LDIAKDSGGILSVPDIEQLKAVKCLEWLSREREIAEMKEEAQKQSKK
jgi:hypothetical protein